MMAWLIFKSFFSKALDIFTRYPLQIILVLVCVYAFWQKSRYDAIVSDYSKYKSAAEQLAKDKEHENEILRNYAKNTVKAVIEEHKQALIGAGLDRKRVEDKLKGSINEISNELNIYRDAVRVRDSADSSIDVSKVADYTNGLASPIGNCNETLATVVDACKVTDYDYEALYNLYQKQCDIFGCE